jgi:hypothetical protein
MTLHDLPRPWLLAALADVPVAELVRPAAEVPEDDEPARALPRADQRRQRLADWRRAGRCAALGADRPN